MEDNIYKIIRIEEEDYGCEARPDDYVPMVRVVLENKGNIGNEVKNGNNGNNSFEVKQQQVVLMQDSVMYARNLNEGDECVIGIDGELYPSEMNLQEDEVERYDLFARRQNEWMDNYYDAVEEMDEM